MASFTKEVYWQLAKRPLILNGHLANRQLTSLVKEATGTCQAASHYPNNVDPDIWCFVSTQKVNTLGPGLDGQNFTF